MSLPPTWLSWRLELPGALPWRPVLPLRGRVVQLRTPVLRLRGRVVQLRFPVRQLRFPVRQRRLLVLRLRFPVLPSWRLPELPGTPTR